jgi:hypothetical protein
MKHKHIREAPLLIHFGYAEPGDFLQLLRSVCDATRRTAHTGNLFSNIIRSHAVFESERQTWKIIIVRLNCLFSGAFVLRRAVCRRE